MMSIMKNDMIQSMCTCSILIGHTMLCVCLYNAFRKNIRVLKLHAVRCVARGIASVVACGTRVTRACACATVSPAKSLI